MSNNRRAPARAVAEREPARLPILATLAICASFALVTATAGCAPKAPPSSTSVAPKPQNLDELRKAIQDILTRSHIPGIGVALVNKNGPVWAGGVGKADLATDRDVTADTLFRVGSITKSFIALALLKLQEEHKIDLNVRVQDIAPEIAIENQWDATDPVRVVHLLEHTAGFDDFALAGFYNFGAPPEMPLRNVFALFPKPQHLRWRPGTRAAYSNPGYGLAGYVIEKVTGRPFEDYIEGNILLPLGMTRSALQITPVVESGIAEGYEGNPPHPVGYRSVYMRSAGELKSSPAEMARFVQMMLNRGSLGDAHIVSPESLARMETPGTPLIARAGLRDGYGLGDYVSLDHRIKTHGHDGGIDGFLSNYAYMPEQGVGYFFSINNSDAGAAPMGGSSWKQIDDLLFDYVTRGIAAPAPAPRVALEPNMSEWTGYYKFDSPRNEDLRFIGLLIGGQWISISNGKLYSRPMLGRRQELIPVGGNLFRTEKEPAPSRVFCIGEDDSRVLAGAFSYFRKQNPIWPVMRLGLIAIGLLLMASSILFALVWVPRKLMGRMWAERHLWVRALPLAAALTFTAMQLLPFGMPPIELATANFRTVGFWLASWLFATLSLGSLAASLWASSVDMNRWARLHTMLVSIACCGIAGYMTWWGVIGHRFWID